eukprot:g9207.t1
MWTAQVAPVEAALLAQASFVQEQGDGELDVEGADPDGILQTGSAFRARETAESEPDSEPIKSLKHVVVVKQLMTDVEIFRMDWSPQQKVKDIAAHCKKALSVAPFVEMKIVRDRGMQPLQPDAEVEPVGGQEEVVLGCLSQLSSLNNLIRVDADKLTAPKTWSARTEDFAQQLAKGTTPLSDTYTDPFAKDFINAAELLFDEMASTPAAEDEPVPVRVASGLQSRVRQVEDAAFSAWEKKEEEKGTLQEGIDTEQQRIKSHSNMAMMMFRGCMKKMRELSRKYYKTSQMEMTAPHYRAYESDDAPDSKYVYARDVRRDVHRRIWSRGYRRRLRAIIVRGHTPRENLGNEDPGLGKWSAKNQRGTGSGNWAIVPFATDSEFTVLKDDRPLLPPPVNFMDIDEWVEKNEAKFPVLGA